MKKNLIFSFDRRLLYHSDWTNFLLVLTLSVIGLLFVFSATYTPVHPVSPLFCKQLFGVLSGIIIYWAVFLLNHRALHRWGAIAYYLALMLLAFTLVKGSIGMGAQRWINLGIVKFQPSELAKLFFPAFFTSALVPHERAIHGFTPFLPILVILGISALLILKQPDLGTALIILFSGILLLWVAQIGRTFFIVLGVTTLLAAPIGWKMLKPYQQKRIVVFLGGGAKNRERYQVEQSRIAIGSGGIWGKGFLKGTQNQLNFLPENQTDFIFSVIGEEMGFFGAFLVLALFCLLFLRAIQRITLLQHVSSQLLALGLVAPLIIAAFINMSMTLGLLPAVGIPLPFITYGITHVWIGFASMGWYNNIVTHGSMLDS